MKISDITNLAQVSDHLMRARSSWAGRNWRQRFSDLQTCHQRSQTRPGQEPHRTLGSRV